MRFQKQKGLFLRRTVAAFMTGLTAMSSQANPQGMTIGRGNASVSGDARNLNITVSQNAWLNWNSFNIGTGETTTFIQPSARSVVWNQINDGNPTEILGRLNGNGHVVLMNQNGFYFGRDSVINVGGFIATTVQPSGPAFSGGSLWQYQGTPPLASIVNYGEIKAASGGSVFLVAEKIENNGVIMVPDGTLGLYAGKEVLLSERPDGRGISAKVALPAGSIDNNGKLIADGGSIALHARVVNQNGIIQANSVRERNGVIELIASERINLGANSVISAQGDSTGVSAGGKIILKAEKTFTDDPASQIDVRGGAEGGKGGFVEVSAKEMSSINSRIDGTAQTGWQGGRLLIDPTDIILGSSGTGTVGSGGTVGQNDSPGTLRLNVNSAFIGFSHITLQATRDITVSANTLWNLNDSTQISDSGSLLTLEAGRNIIFGNNARIVAGTGWSVSLAAGADFTAPLHVQSGVGGIYLNGGVPDANGNYALLSGSLETTDGSINLRAGKEILVGSGFIRTVGGGDIFVSALSGNVDAGRKKDGYVFSPLGYSVSPAGLGGIATANGGDVTIQAGGDILSILPTVGAYGGGDVTLLAGGSIYGKFLVRDGVGTLSALHNVGSAANQASLALIKGGWNVTAGQDLYLNEVFNPNGSLNPNRLRNGHDVRFEFDYALDAYVRLLAGNSVQLLGGSLARTADNPDRLPIYAPRLEITAGPGGVVLGNDLVLYPSPQGGLKITTTSGGSLVSSAGNSYQIVMSDSDSADYTTFTSRHATKPLHLANADEPVRVNVSGNIENIRMQMPKRSLIEVAGDAINFFFTGQNLRRSDDTRIIIGGDFRNRADFTSISVSTPPNVGIFGPGVTTQPGLNLFAKLSYNPATGKLTFTGRMTEAERNFLLNPVVYVLDPETRQPVLDPQGNPLTKRVTFASAAVINALFANSQDVPSFPTKNGGILIAGPGSLSMFVRNMDLGITAGIRSILAGYNPALARLHSRGADINLTLAGDLKMTSSQIASFNGGAINILAGGKLDIGSQDAFTSDDTPKGIYTGHGGNVKVVAAGNIVINGSRIASYDGGDVTVISTQGSVDAGAGAKGFFGITTQQYNPLTGRIEDRIDRFFGSGIMALTRLDSTATVGNILVKAAKDILANAGGILQLAFNASANGPAHVDLEAGRDIKAKLSGILGVNVNLKAEGDIEGLVVANRDISIEAKQSVNVSALASGSVNVSAGESVSGSIVGGGDVNISGDSISASVISTGGNTALSGDSESATTGAFTGVVAVAAPKSTDEAEKTIAENKTALFEGSGGDGEAGKTGKGGRRPTLAKSTGRVTVILPPKTN